MDKYEYKLKLEQLKNLVEAEDYVSAAEMADSINWKKVRSVNTLCMVGKIYEKVGRYDASKEVLLQAYDHAPLGRNIIRKLTEIAILGKHPKEAEEFYHEFVEIAPKDNARYVLAYQISCLKDAPLSDRIGILEVLKEKEYTEKWAYELAALYRQADMREKCVAACDELVLWFGDGEYVEKALDLKRLYQPLTPSQEEKYRKFQAEKAGLKSNQKKPVSQPKAVKTETDKTEAPKAESSKSEGTKTEEHKIVEAAAAATKFNAEDLQKELAKSMKQIRSATERETVSSTMNNIKKIVNDIPYLNGEQPTDLAEAKDHINEKVDQKLQEDFRELLEDENSSDVSPESESAAPAETAQPSIEDVLAEWEKTKKAAEAAIAAAEQKKLKMEKDHALQEAGEIMERLKTLIPILSAKPGEDLPAEDDIETVGDKLTLSEEEKEALKAVDEMPEETAVDIEPEKPEASVAAIEPEAPAVEVEPEKLEEPDIEPETISVTEAVKAEEVAEDDIETAADTMTDADKSAEESITESDTPSEDPTAQEEYKAQTSETAEEDLAATRKMPDLSGMRSGIRVSREEAAEKVNAPEARTTTAASEAAKAAESTKAADINAETKTEETAEDREEEKLEKILAQATQVMLDNSDVEVPVEREAQEKKADVLPEIKLPDDIAEDELQGRIGILSEEQRQLFSYFLPVPGMEEQICQILQGAQSRIGNSITSLTGNILIQGEEGSGKTVLATSLIKAIQKEVGNEGAKIGKISAASLNDKDFAALVPRIGGGYLIIDKAGELNQETAVRMSQVMEQNTQGMVVVLEDTKAGIKKAMNLDFGFSKKFTEKINIPIFTIDELVDFGKSYAEEMECVIDEMGVLALYNRINNIQKLEKATTLAEVKDIVDEAIESAESGGIKKAFGSLFTKKYNDSDYLILREKDFEN